MSSTHTHDPHTGLLGDGKMVWYSYLFKNFLQFVVIHRVKGFGMVNEAELDGFFPGIPLLSL